MKTTVFRDVVSCSLVEVDRRFRGAYCFHHQGSGYGVFKDAAESLIVHLYNIKW
jgi:hypothetical protein